MPSKLCETSPAYRLDLKFQVLNPFRLPCFSVVIGMGILRDIFSVLLFVLKLRFSPGQSTVRRYLLKTSCTSWWFAYIIDFPFANLPNHRSFIL